MVQSLQALAEQTTNKVMRDIIKDICTRVEGGDSFSEALQKHPKAFSRLYVCMVAAGEKGGTPMDFLNKFHDRIGSFHLKDRTLPEHCSLNLAWGQGETPIKEILELVQKNKWPLPATIEQEYEIPKDSDAVKEVRKCLDYCRTALG